ncbi:MAG: sigma 54-interacting transcriptional regulator [Dehalobacterium sp.]
MLVSVVSTINGLCKKCYSCIRNCPAKAIKVEQGQAMVVPDLCIGCAHCVEVCSQKAKKIVSGIEKTNYLLKENKSIACLAPSFIAQYPKYHPGQIISALKLLGFHEVWEVAFGAQLVTKAYTEQLTLWQKEKTHFISTACPAVVNLVEKHYPELIPYLIPIVSPMIALGRYLKAIYGEKCRVVFIGPCVAKKEEADNVMVQGAVDAVLTYQELDQMFHNKNIDPEKFPLGKWNSPEGNLGRLFPVSGGLLKSASLNIDPLEYGIVKIEGRENCLHFLNAINKNRNKLKFADILFCDGCISGPILNSDLDKLEKQKLIIQYTKDCLSRKKTNSSPSQVKINMMRDFRNRSLEKLYPTEKNIRAILSEMGKFIPEDELNCGACGYNSCRDKAVAVFRGLAESKMCLPFLITSLESHNDHLRKQLKNTAGINNIIGNSPVMQKVYDIIKKVSPTDSTVLVRGNSGTGKELVTLALHHGSLRNKNAFVSINCAALPENLLESEIFGYAKGAFTGAVAEKKGLFEEANGGTLFLDEIGDLSPRLQGKLLRVLQEGEFFRIGETVPRKCDVRIIAATNQNLEELIQEKKFREDLYYRLNVVTINLPDLRERQDDIPILIKHFLHKFNTKHGKNILTVSQEAMTALVGASWLGNVRELENAIERAVILSDGEELKLEDLPPSVRTEYSKNEDKPMREFTNYHQAIEEYKKKIITRAIEDANGVQAKAARQLGIGRSTLNEIIKKLNITLTK